MRAAAKIFVMPRTKIFSLTLLAMLAFAGSSLLCRVALKHTSMRSATFWVAAVTDV